MPVTRRMTLTAVAVAVAVLASGCATRRVASSSPPTPTASSVGVVSPLPITPLPQTLPITRTRTPRPTPAATPTKPREGTSHELSEQDSGTTIHVKAGDTIEVALPSEYHQPEAASDVLTRTSAEGGYPTKQPAKATFVASRGGSADISSGTDYECLHTTPQCGIPQRLWTVHVVVEG